MESNSTKVEMMKPVFVKAGIPLAITIAGYIIAKITTRRQNQETPHERAARCSKHTAITQDPGKGPTPDEVSRNDQGGLQNLEEFQPNSPSCSSTNTIYQDSLETFPFQEKSQFEQDLQNFEAKFHHYSHLKDQEIALLDMHNKLVQEINKIDFLAKEITLMESESQRFQNMVLEYLGIMELVEMSQSENKLLQRKVKKLLKNIRARFRVIKEQKSQLEAKETEILRNNQESEMKDGVIKNMELEIQQLKMAIVKLQGELAENSSPSKDNYKELVNELEQVQKEKAAEDKELIYLRWCNACLRHELMRNQEEIKNHQDLNFGLENAENNNIVEPEHDELIMRRSSSVGHHESCLSSPIIGGKYSGNDHSKRRKLMQKFKKWVEGSDKMKHENNCFKRHSVSDHPTTTEDLILSARKSSASG